MYLEETQNGNIVKGFDNYIKGGVTRRKTVLNDADRIFSLSSLTYAARVFSILRVVCSVCVVCVCSD